MNQPYKNRQPAKTIKLASIHLKLSILLLSFSLGSVTPALSQPAAQADFECSGVTEIPATECEALVAFYESTGGPNWTINTGWLQNNSPCGWEGIECMEGHISNIELSRNALMGAIPAEFGNLLGLRRLYLGANQITSLPAEFGNLGELHRLYLGGNLLSSLPPEFGNLLNLRILVLAANQFTSLPVEIGNLTNLRELDLHYNQLAHLPSEFGNLSNLYRLLLNENLLTSLPPTFGNLSNLGELYIWDNQLSGLPVEFGNLENLYRVDLSDNHLSGLPTSIGNLTNVSQLSLSNNLLSNLPTEIGDLSSLYFLDISNNQLTSLPPEFGSLISLTYLSLSNNQLSELPPEFGNLSILHELHLNNNLLTSLPSEFSNLRNLWKLYLSNNQLIELPYHFGNLTTLSYLEAHNNRLSSLPDGFGNLSDLSTLEIYNNRLSSLPSSFGDLLNLYQTDLAGNRLTSLPPEIGNLSRLTHLKLSGNQLSNLPAEIGSLEQLKSLNLSNNRLTNLPPEFTLLWNLDWLNLANNLLSNLPTEFDHLLGLGWLDLSFNRLSISSPDLLDYLQLLDPDWANTQTITPTNFQLLSAAPNSLDTTWTPILFTDGPGFYELSYTTESNGTYTVHGSTSDKSSNQYLFDNLPESERWSIVLRTFSQAHDEQKKDIWSEYSAPITVFNASIDADSGGSLVFTSETNLVTRAELPPGAVSSPATLFLITQEIINPQPAFRFNFVGQPFNLGLYQDESYTENLPLSNPMTLTINYPEDGLGEDTLWLRYWDPVSEDWIEATQTCSPRGSYSRNLVENWLAATVCRLGKYALVEERPAIFLPAITQNSLLP